mgnify:CR=1 FL=1
MNLQEVTEKPRDNEQQKEAEQKRLEELEEWYSEKATKLRELVGDKNKEDMQEIVNTAMFEWAEK